MLKQLVLRFDPLPHGALPNVNLKSPLAPLNQEDLQKKKKITMLFSSTVTVGPWVPWGTAPSCGGLGPTQLSAPGGDPVALLPGVRGALWSSLCWWMASTGEPGSPVWRVGGRGKGGRKGGK